MENYKSNSKLSKNKDNKNEPVKRVKVDKIVNGHIRTKKKNALLGLFLSDDILDLKSYLISDVLIPAIKNAVTDGIDMAFYGEHRSRSNRKSSIASRISYREYYDRDDRYRDRDRDRDRDKYGSRNRRGYEYDDIILDSRSEAEAVLSKLDEMIDVYGLASVGDLYELVGLKGQYTNNHYGWTNLRNASSVRVRDGYLLKLPVARPIDL